MNYDLLVVAKKKASMDVSATKVPQRAHSATVTISASVPEHVVKVIRSQVGAREFSQFVTRSLERELVRMNRVKFIDHVVQHSGPLTPKEIARARRLLAD
jgi:hypothetical protein